MAVNQNKAKVPELTTTPELSIATERDEKRGQLFRNKSGLNLHERVTGLLGTDARMGRRPSTLSLGNESTIQEHEENSGYFNLKRVFDVEILLIVVTQSTKSFRAEA